MQDLLMIEDDSRLAQMVGQYLRQSGFSFRHAALAQEGLDAVAQRLPDLVILDLMLPDLDGLEVCRRLRAFQFQKLARSEHLIHLQKRPLECDAGRQMAAKTKQNSLMRALALPR